MAVISSGVAALLVSAVVGGVGLPFGVPPAPEDPMMGRVAPEKCLFHLSWAGTASPDAKSSNQTEQLLAEPEVQHFLKQIGTLIANKVKTSMGKNELLTDDPLGLLRHVTTHPVAIFVGKSIPGKTPANKTNATKTDSRKPKPDDLDATVINVLRQCEAAAVVSLGADAALWKAKARKPIELWNPLGVKNEIVPLDGDDWYARVQFDEGAFPSICLGFRGDYFIAASSEKVFKDVVTRMKNEPPRWWTDIQKKLPIERRSLVAYADLQAITRLVEPLVESRLPKDLAAAMEMLGLANARAWIEVWGLEGRDFANKSLLLLDGEPQGLLRVLADRPIRPEDAAAIPSDATFGVACRFDAQKAMDVVLVLRPS